MFFKKSKIDLFLRLYAFFVRMTPYLSTKEVYQNLAISII